MIQVKNSPNLLESGTELQNSERSSKKSWIISTVVGLIVTIFFSGILTYYFLHFKVPESCWAQASLDTKTEATDYVEVKDWKWSKIPTSCMKKTENEKLSIIQDGNFLIYSQMKRRSKSYVPFAIRLMRGDEVLSQSQSKEDIIVLLGIYHLNEGDEISLDLNDDNFEHIEKNSTQTYWGILRVPPYHS